MAKQVEMTVSRRKNKTTGKMETTSNDWTQRVQMVTDLEACTWKQLYGAHVELGLGKDRLSKSGYVQAVLKAMQDKDLKLDQVEALAGSKKSTKAQAKPEPQGLEAAQGKVAAILDNKGEPVTEPVLVPVDPADVKVLSYSRAARKHEIYLEAMLQEAGLGKHTGKARTVMLEVLIEAGLVKPPQTRRVSGPAPAIDQPENKGAVRRALIDILADEVASKLRVKRAVALSMVTSLTSETLLKLAGDWGLM